MNSREHVEQSGAVFLTSFRAIDRTEEAPQAIYHILGRLIGEF